MGGASIFSITRMSPFCFSCLLTSWPSEFRFLSKWNPALFPYLLGFFIRLLWFHGPRNTWKFGLFSALATSSKTALPGTPSGIPLEFCQSMALKDFDFLRQHCYNSKPNKFKNLKAGHLVHCVFLDTHSNFYWLSIFVCHRLFFLCVMSQTVCWPCMGVYKMSRFINIKRLKPRWFTV